MHEQERAVAAQRAFDYDLLRKLITGDPSLTDQQLADALTADNRRRDPNAPEVQKNTVRSVLAKHRKVWAVPLRHPAYEEIRPPEGAMKAGPEGGMSTPYRYVRDLCAAKAGVEPHSPQMIELRSQSTAWLERMRLERKVLDLTGEGAVIERPARAEELNSRGEVISVMAWLIPGWRDLVSL